MKVTAETITDEQIRELCKASPTSNPIAAWCAESLAGSRWSRALCADAWNARHEVTP